MLKQSNRSNYVSTGYDLDEVTSVTYAANMHRDYFMIYNKSNTDIQITFGSGATTDDAVDIPPNSFYEPLMVPTNTFTISASTDARVIILTSDPDSKV